MIRVYQLAPAKAEAIFPKTPFMYGMGDSFTGTDVLNLFNDHYVHVADLDCDTLDQAFEIGNIGPEHKYTRHARMHSVSVGDVLRYEDSDELLVVAPSGFVNLGLPLNG